MRVPKILSMARLLVGLVSVAGYGILVGVLWDCWQTRWWSGPPIWLDIVFWTVPAIGCLGIGLWGLVPSIGWIVDKVWKENK